MEGGSCFDIFFSTSLTVFQTYSLSALTTCQQMPLCENCQDLLEDCEKWQTRHPDKFLTNPWLKLLKDTLALPREKWAVRSPGGGRKKMHTLVMSDMCFIPGQMDVYVNEQNREMMWTTEIPDITRVSWACCEFKRGGGSRLFPAPWEFQGNAHSCSGWLFWARGRKNSFLP